MIRPPIAAIRAQNEDWDQLTLVVEPDHVHFMANLVKKTLSTLLDKISAPGRVLAVRPWAGQTMYELDLHLPTIDMTKWMTIPRLKCRVEPHNLTYRDYTPATWNPNLGICTLYIEAGHLGAGSRWVQRLVPGDSVWVSPAHAEKLPATPGRMLALGDGSALGHILALKQLTSRSIYPLDACVAIYEQHQVPSGLQTDHPDMALLPTAQVEMTLTDWLYGRSLSDYTSVYVAGNMKLVASLRRQLKTKPELQARFYVTGFWQ